MKLIENLKILREKIKSSAEKSCRQASQITCIAVSKNVSRDLILRAWEEGILIFGENQIQEAMHKISTLPPEMTWHMIGHLQTNKIRDALKLFKVIQSVDSLKLAEKLSGRAQNLQVKVDVLLEVNIAQEPSKFGFLEEDLARACEEVRKLPGLNVKGLMTVAPYLEDSERTRPYFKRMKVLFDEISDLEILSMGMSHDYPVAIEEGATMIRVGQAIFGARK